MPAFYFRCNTCTKELRRILPKFKVLPCECGGEFHRTDQTNPSTMIKEVLDNGIMVRKVERLHNIEELIKERSKDPEDTGVV